MEITMPIDKTPFVSLVDDNPVKGVLILSSTEGCSIARAVKTYLEKRQQLEATIWDEVAPSGWQLEHVIKMIQEFPYVILVLSPDDISRCDK